MIAPPVRLRLEFAAKAFLVAAFLGTLSAGVLRLEQSALADPVHRVDLGAWSIVEAPPWSNADDVRAVRDATRLPGASASLLDAEAGAVVLRAIESAPQVVRVAAMRRRYPNQYEAVLELREPVAAVQIGAARAWIEVDREGVALGKAVGARPVRAGRPLRVIVGAAGGAVAPGNSFGPDVAEAADLSSELDRCGTEADRALLQSIDEIDVSNFGARSRRDAPEVLLRK